jgi:hypothetical protein
MGTGRPSRSCCCGLFISDEAYAQLCDKYLTFPLSLFRAWDDAADIAALAHGNPLSLDEWPAKVPHKMNMSQPTLCSIHAR